jgi:hypothetical protein
MNGSKYFDPPVDCKVLRPRDYLENWDKSYRLDQKAPPVKNAEVFFV